MIRILTTILLVLAFSAAALENLRGGAKLQADYRRWGYPARWNLVTAVLEVVAAALIAFPVTRAAGLALGALIVTAAIVTLVRARDFSHLLPPAVFAVLLIMDRTWS